MWKTQNRFYESVENNTDWMLLMVLALDQSRYDYKETLTIFNFRSSEIWKPLIM